MAFLAPVLGVVGSLYSGITGMQAANYRGAVADRNAKLSEQNAQMAGFRGQVDAQDQDFLAAQELAQRQSAMAASGVDLDSPTFALKTLADRVLARRDTLRIKHDSKIEVRNLKQQAVSYRAEGASERASGKVALFGSVLGAGNSLINSALRVKEDRYRTIMAG